MSAEQKALITAFAEMETDVKGTVKGITQTDNGRRALEDKDGFLEQIRLALYGPKTPLTPEETLTPPHDQTPETPSTPPQSSGATNAEVDGNSTSQVESDDEHQGELKKKV